MTEQEKPVLLLIDIQKGFENVEYWGTYRNNLYAEENAGKLLDFWRDKGFPVFHIKHDSLNPNSPLAEGKEGNEFQEIVKPKTGEPVIKKGVNSAFIGTDLKEQLDKNGIKTLVIAGLTTDHCVSTTIRMAGNYGYETFVLSDATATFDRMGANGEKYSAELMHEIALASLHHEFALVVKTEEIINKYRF